MERLILNVMTIMQLIYVLMLINKIDKLKLHISYYGIDVKRQSILMLCFSDIFRDNLGHHVFSLDYQEGSYYFSPFDDFV